jgi:hypothetical protein
LETVSPQFSQIAAVLVNKVTGYFFLDCLFKNVYIVNSLGIDIVNPSLGRSQISQLSRKMKVVSLSVTNGILVFFRLEFIIHVVLPHCLCRAEMQKAPMHTWFKDWCTENNQVLCLCSRNLTLSSSIHETG